MSNISCDIIIPVLDQLELTRKCLESIRDRTHSPCNLTLVDNNSGQDTKDFLKKFASENKFVKIVNNAENLGWVRAVNQGMKLSASPYICVMNNDTVAVTEDWLNKMIAVAELEPEIGLVNPRFDIKNEASSGNPFIEIDFCRGYCVLVKRSVMERIGSLDEAYGLGYYDDDDYSVRAIRAGFKCVRANDVVVRHLRDSTFSSVFTDTKRRELHEKNKRLFYSKWGKRLKLVFINTRGNDKNLSDLAISLARRQHVVYLWSRAPLNIEHINIREKILPELFFRYFAPVGLALNKAKRPEKRYDLVFFDDAKLGRLIQGIRPDASCIDIEKDRTKIDQLVDSAARDSG